MSIISCISLPPTALKNQSSKSAIKPSRHAFLKIYSQFLNNPSAASLSSVKEYMSSPDGMGDKYLLSYRSQRKFSNKYFKKILANINKGDTYTVRSLLYLAFNLNQSTLVTESQIISSEMMNMASGKHARTVRSAAHLLGVHISYNFPKLLIKSLADELKEVNEKQHKQYLSGVANFGLEDERFRPVCPNCPSQPAIFFEAKYKKLSKIAVSTSAEVNVQKQFRRTYLARTTAPPVLQIRQLLFESSRSILQKIRNACYYKSHPSSTKPSINDLGKMASKKVVDALTKGDLNIARALVIVSGERCWKELNGSDGPKAWLSTVLICHQPKTFLRAVALENPGSLFLDQIMNFDSPQGWINCTGEATGSGHLATYRIQKLKKANNINPAEKKVLQHLVRNFGPTDTKFTGNRSPAQEHKIKGNRD